MKKFCAFIAAVLSFPVFAQTYPSKPIAEQFAAFLRQDREIAAKKVKASGAKLD